MHLKQYLPTAYPTQWYLIWSSLCLQRVQQIYCSVGIQPCHNIPHYPQSNGKAESACNTLLKKAKLANLTLLNHRNTPTEPINLSPAQRLFDRHTQTLLPSSIMLLKPEILQQVLIKLKAVHQKQAEHYDRAAKPLPP